MIPSLLRGFTKSKNYLTIHFMLLITTIVIKVATYEKKVGISYLDFCISPISL